MTQLHSIVLACSTILLSFLYGCVAETGIDTRKFAGLEQTAETLRTAVTSSDPCTVPPELEERLASGISTLQDKTSSKGERDLLAAYAQLLATYRDGLLLCRSRGHLANLRLIPEGRIFLTQELDPLVRKYDLPSVKHVYKPTGQHMRSIDGNAIAVIWARAQAQIKNTENILHYH